MLNRPIFCGPAPLYFRALLSFTLIVRLAWIHLSFAGESNIFASFMHCRAHSLAYCRDCNTFIERVTQFGRMHLRWATIPVESSWILKDVRVSRQRNPSFLSHSDSPWETEVRFVALSPAPDNDFQSSIHRWEPTAFLTVGLALLPYTFSFAGPSRASNRFYSVIIGRNPISGM